MNIKQSQNIRVLTPDVVGVLKKRQWLDASTALLVCVGCNKKNITGPIVAFFNFQGENLLCYSCQKLSQATEVLPTTPLSAKKPVEKQTQNKVVEKKYKANKNFRDWENRTDTITEKQITLLQQLIIEKIEDENERQAQLDSMDQLTKVEASKIINSLLNGAF